MITAKVRLAGLLLFVATLVSLSTAGRAQCVTPELIMINSCIEHPNSTGGPDVESEIIIMSTGLFPVAVNTIGINLPNNSFGLQNRDLGNDLDGLPLGCDYKIPTITTLPGCPGAIPAGPGDFIPENALIVLFLTSATTTENIDSRVDFTNICTDGRPVYILQSACERTSGAFANGPGQGNTIRSVSISSPCGVRVSTYDAGGLDPEDGTYYLVGTSTTGNMACEFPVIPVNCVPIDTTFYLCGYGATVDPPVPVSDFNVLFPSNVLIVTIHRSPQEAELGQNSLTEYAGMTNQPDTLYSRARFENTCVAVSRFIVQFPDSPIPAMSPLEPVRGCDPLAGIGTFNLPLNDLEIGGGTPVTWYTDLAATQEIPDPENFSSPGTTVYAVVGAGACAGMPAPVELELSSGPMATAVADSTCANNSIGSITVSAVGFEPFDYDWAVDQYDGDSIISGLSAGQYPFTVTDRYGCSVEATSEVFARLQLQIGCTVVQGTSGLLTPDGIVRITFSQGDGPYELTYSGAAAGAMEVNGASVDITGLPAGDYTFSATDADGCASEVCTLNVPFANALMIMCRTRANSNDTLVIGSGQVDISGGEAPFLVRVTDENNNSTDYPNRPNGATRLPNLVSGEYTVTVIDASGQMETCTINIVLLDCPLTIVDVQISPAGCDVPISSGITITVAGNLGAVTTTWSGDNGIENFNGQQDTGPVPPGIYFVTISDESTCDSVTDTIEVIDPGTLESPTITGDFTASPCQDDARIDVILNGGGTSPYTVVLIDGDTSTELDRITGQSAGDMVSFGNLTGGGIPDYAVYVIDTIGCVTNRVFTPISASPDSDLSLNPPAQQITGPNCTGDSTGMLTLMASGGTDPYVYRWIAYPQLATGRVLTDGPSQTDLPAGNYSVEITDANGCLDTAMVVVPDGTLPTISCGPTTDAIGNLLGSVILTLNDGTAPYSIQIVREGIVTTFSGLAGPTEELTNLQAGDYLASIVDENGCESETCAFTIEAIPCSLPATAVIDTITCVNNPEGGIALTIDGGTAPYLLNWAVGVTGDSADVRVTIGGNYGVTISDANGCALDTSFNVPDIMNQTELMLETPRFLPACPGEDVRIPLEFGGTPPYVLNYVITHAPGLDFPEVFNSNERFDTLTISFADFVDQDAEISIERLTDRYCDVQIIETFQVGYTQRNTIRRMDATCEMDPIEIGGRFFDAQNPSDTFLFDDGSACGVIYEVDLDFQMSAVPDTVIVPVCPATLYEENGEVFDANRPEGEVSYSRPGMCDSLVYIRLDILPEYVGSFSDNACAGDTIFYADRFFTAENTSGLARLPGMAASGCDSLVFVNTTFRRTGEVRLFGDFEICPGDSIELRFTYDGPGGINVRMTDLAGNITDLPGIQQGSRVELFPTESTSYQLLSSGIGGCPGEVAGSSSVTIDDLSIGTEVLLDPRDYCQDTLGLASVNYTGGTGPYDIAWSNGPTDSINRNLLAGTYLVSVTDAIGCTLTDSVMLNNLIPLTARVTGIPPDCPGGFGSLQIDTIFGGGGFYEVSIDGQLFLPIEQVSDIQVPVGNHQAIFQGANDCSVEVNFSVNDALIPNFNLPTDTTIFLGDSILLDGSLVNQDSAWWTPQTFLSDPNSSVTWAAPPSSSNFTLHLRTLAQCLFTHDVNITVDERLLVFAPTAFSPNGDGTNDFYSIGLGRNVRALRTFQIFNRWGNLMYEGVDGWDGEFAGDSAPPAVYIFYALVEMADGSERFVEGDFVLMR